MRYVIRIVYNNLVFSLINRNLSVHTVSAEKALKRLNFEILLGRSIRLMWSEKDSTKRKSGIGNIIVKNLQKTIANKDLHSTFSTFGNILSSKVSLDETGASKGYGFVHFESEMAANLAIETVDGMFLSGTRLNVQKFKKPEVCFKSRSLEFV